MPVVLNCWLTHLAVLLAIANPTPWLPPLLRRDRRVDSDDFAVKIHQRTAAVARIDRRIGLNETGSRAAQRTSAGADDAGRHGAFKPEGVAERQNPIAHLGFIAVAELGGRQRAGALDAKNGQIGLRIALHVGRLELATVAQPDRNLAGPFDNMVVRQNDPGRIDNHARPHAARFAERHVASRHLRHILEEPAELRRHVSEWIDALGDFRRLFPFRNCLLNCRSRLNHYHGRQRLLGHRAKRVRQRFRVTHSAVRCRRRSLGAKRRPTAAHGRNGHDHRDQSHGPNPRPAVRTKNLPTHRQNLLFSEM